jgi:transcriptional regulator with XRE-family HTH domain
MSGIFGKYLTQLRTEKGMSQRELADKSKISNTEISRIESGLRKNPAPATLRSLAIALGIEYRDLMKMAGYIEEIHEKDKFYELVFKNDDGEIVDAKRGVKDMFRKDEEWANIAYRVSSEISDNDRKILKEMALSFLKNKNTK